MRIEGRMVKGKDSYTWKEPQGTRERGGKRETGNDGRGNEKEAKRYDRKETTDDDMRDLLKENRGKDRHTWKR